MFPVSNFIKICPVFPDLAYEYIRIVELILGLLDHNVALCAIVNMQKQVPEICRHLPKLKFEFL
jgi:hypothetical protein